MHSLTLISFVFFTGLVGLLIGAAILVLVLSRLSTETRTITSRPLSPAESTGVEP